MVENLSDNWLSSQSPYPVHLSYHLLDPETKEVIVFDGLRSILEGGVAPRSRSTHRLTVDQSLKGEFIIQPMLVQEGVAWFDHPGGYEGLVVELR
jgi:hypothetical protein